MNQLKIGYLPRFPRRSMNGCADICGLSIPSFRNSKRMSDKPLVAENLDKAA
jgi:hypothetical protein